VIILVVLTLIASRFVYLPPSWLLLPPTEVFAKAGLDSIAMDSKSVFSFSFGGRKTNQQQFLSSTK
jgi:hypothetical protein